MIVVVDMNLSPKWVGFLQSAAIRAVHWSSLGAGDDPDSKIIRYAREHDGVILTRDLDFGVLLIASGQQRPSIIQLRVPHGGPEKYGAEVKAALRRVALAGDQGVLITIASDKVRMRMLGVDR